MGRKKGLSKEERKKVVDMALSGMSIKEITKKIKRCMHTVYKTSANPFGVRTRPKKMQPGKLTDYQLKCVRRTASGLPLASSKQFLKRLVLDLSQKRPEIVL